MPYHFELCFYASFSAASCPFFPFRIAPKRKSDFIRLLLIGLFITIGYATMLRLNVNRNPMSMEYYIQTYAFTRAAIFSHAASLSFAAAAVLHLRRNTSSYSP